MFHFLLAGKTVHPLKGDKEKMDKLTFYNFAWKDPNQCPEYVTWVKQRKDNKHFTCKVCNTSSRSLRNIIAEALKSHYLEIRKLKRMVKVSTRRTWTLLVLKVKDSPK